ncbi:MAG: carboxypeptidase-like regulatory domain-containing protein [Acidobacteriota bacterium]|nr:carboxypeptidase-like regulatory domain-containing protein [Acidobacteriota bacterium]
MRTFCVLSFLAVLLTATPSAAATIRGTVSDTTGAALPSARVVLRDIATGQEIVSETDAQGGYKFDAPAVGSYLVIVTRSASRKPLEQ